MSGVVWQRSGEAATPSRWTPLLSWLDIAVALTCPPALAVALPLALVWKPRRGAFWWILTAVLVGGPAYAYWYWATTWHGGQGGLAEVARGWLIVYLTTLRDIRDVATATRQLPLFDPEAVKAGLWATWRVWVPLGYLLGGFHALLGTSDDDGLPGGVRPGSPRGGQGLRAPHAGTRRSRSGVPGDNSQGNKAPSGSPVGSHRGARFPGDVAPPGHRPGLTEDDDEAGAMVPPVEQATQREPPPRQWLIQDLVPYGPLPRWRFAWQWPYAWREIRGYITALVGMAGTAKSYLLLAFCIAALLGVEWCGLVITRVKNILYVDCELDSETFWRRAYCVARGFGLDEPPKGLHYLNLNGISLATDEAWEAVWDAVQTTKSEAVALDSITIGAFTISTNDPAAVNRLFGGFECWGVPVFAIDHLGKDPDKGAVGTFMKYAKIRSELTLRAIRKGLIKATHSKTNFGPTIETLQIEARFVGGKIGEPPLTVSFVPEGTPESAGDRLIAEALAMAPIPRPRALPPYQPPEDDDEPGDDGDDDTPPVAPRPRLPAQLAPESDNAGDETPPALAPVFVPALSREEAMVAGAGLTGDDKWNAIIHAVYRQRAGLVVSREAVAELLGCSVKRVANSLGPLRRQGLVESVAPGQWRAIAPASPAAPAAGGVSEAFSREAREPGARKK